MLQQLLDAIQLYHEARENLRKSEEGSEEARIAVAHAAEAWRMLDELSRSIPQSAA